MTLDMFLAMKSLELLLRQKRRRSLWYLLRKGRISSLMTEFSR
jgi:hypothetical protein